MGIYTMKKMSPISTARSERRIQMKPIPALVLLTLLRAVGLGVDRQREPHN